MPRDRRLYMTFPIDFYEHPKVVPLSDAAFRAFVEMNGYSRRHDLDGRIPAKAARLKWRSRALAELVASHPERPLVTLDGDEYVIRDYAEHQFTADDLEALRAKRSQAGAKGAAKRWHNDATPVANAIANESQNMARDRDRDTLATDVANGGPRKRGARIPDDFAVTPEMAAWARENCPNVDGRRSTEMFVNYWRAKTGRDATKLDWPATWRNWMLRDQENAHRNTGRLTRDEENLAVVARLAAREQHMEGIEA
ncbi:hypothetical protein [Humibacter sp.]|uniref:hypothetical protein n=1 Tax=Humibacter sp. TaxID=1940291 RepID=UPI003F7F54F9